MTTITNKDTAVQLRRSDSDSRWRSRRTEHEDNEGKKSLIVSEELPEILQEVEERVADRLQSFKHQEAELQTKRQADELLNDKIQREKECRAQREKERLSKCHNQEDENRVAMVEEQNQKERLHNEETDQAFKDFQADKDPSHVLTRCNSIKDRLRSFETVKEDSSDSPFEETTCLEEDLDINSQLREIDEERAGYDPEKERELHCKADDVFKTYQTKQKRSGSLRVKRGCSSKPKKIVKALTFEEDYTRAQQRVVIRKNTERRKLSEPNIKSITTNSDDSAQPLGSAEYEDNEVVSIDEGHVKRQMQMFYEAVADNPKEYSKAKHSENSNSIKPEAIGIGKEIKIAGIENLSVEEINAVEALRVEEQKVQECKRRMASLRLSNRTEEALEQEEQFHEAALAISKCKRRLLHFGIEVTVVGHHGGETIKLVRQSKIIADVSAQSPEQEDGTIPEGIVINKVKNYED